MTTEKKSPILAALDGLSNSTKNQRNYSNSASSQRTRILEHFSKCPRLSTMEAREELGVLHPSGRIMELRQKGHKIDMHWIKAPDSNGVIHRVGLYVLKSEVSHERT